MIFNENSQNIESQTMTEKEAFRIVFNNMTNDNALSIFKGTYDATNGSDLYMAGVSTVMEYIAYRVSEDVGDSFSDMFIKNEVASEKLANQLLD